MALRSAIEGPRAFAAALALLSCACGPQLGDLAPGERGRVVRAFNGDMLELDSGLVVFLAEIEAPDGEAPYARQAQGELEALTLHRDVLLAYGGARRWRNDDGTSEAALAHVFVQSEGGGWFWLQHELVARGAAMARPRSDNHARSALLSEVEARAREAERGLWRQRAYRPLTPRAAARAALNAASSCDSGAAPYRLVEGRVGQVRASDSRAALLLAGAPAETPFALVVYGDAHAAWSGPPLAALGGAQVRARGPLGVFDGEAQLCLEHAAALEVLEEEDAR